MQVHFSTLINTKAGMITFIGIILALVGIAIAGKAGVMKEKDLDDDHKKETVEEFSLWKGIIVATVSGILSASFAFGLTAGKPIADIALAKGTQSLFMNNPRACMDPLGRNYNKPYLYGLFKY